MGKLNISLLGTFRVTTGGGHVLPIETDKAQALLAYLALEAGRPHPRETLAALLWPETSARKARASLRQALYMLNKALEPPVPAALPDQAGEPAPVDPGPQLFSPFQSTRREIVFSGDGRVWLDVTTFTGLLDAFRAHLHRDPETCQTCAEHLERAIGLYRGDLLSGLSITDSPAFEEWRRNRQEELHGQALVALRHLASYYERRRDYARAEHHLQRELALEPWSEEAHRQRMRVLALDGQRSAALAQYKTCCRVLAEELGTIPSVETTRLFQQIEAGMAEPARESPADVKAANPYKGLSSFAEADAADFYGRDTFAERLLQAVQRSPHARSPVVALVGPSGSGKSSLVYAGLLPKLRAGAGWTVVDLRPGAQPFQRLVDALSGLLPGGGRSRASGQAALVEALRSGRQSLAEAVAGLPALHPTRVSAGGGPERRLLIVVDAFEELFTLCRDPASRRAFLDLLFGPVTGPGATRLPYTLLFVLRADFFGQVLSYPGIDDALRSEYLILGQMGRAELRQAIEAPAQARGVVFQPGLVARLLDDAGDEPGKLPMLQFTLTRLWDQQEGHVLTHAAYDEIGGLAGALAGYAEEVYARLNAQERESARRAFTRMVNPGQGTQDTRRPVAPAELSEGEWKTVRKLADARLVVTGRDRDGQETSELVHEALIHAWGRLRAWVEADQAFHFWLHRLRTAIRQWEASGRDEGALLRGALLGEALEWHTRREDDLSEGQRAFIAASAALRDRELAEDRAHARALERAVQLAQSLRLAAHARLALRDDNTDLALALAWEANQVPHPPPESQRVLAEAAYAPGTRRLYRGHRAGVDCAALSPDGRTLLSGAVDGSLIWWDLETGQVLSRLEGHGGAVCGAAFFPDGRRALSASADHTLILWDLASAKALRHFHGHTDAVLDVALCPDCGAAGAGRGGAAAGSDGAAISASRDGSLILWDVESGRLLHRFQGHQGAVLCVDVHPGDGAAYPGGVALSGSEDRSLILWDLARRTAVRHMPGYEGYQREPGYIKGHYGFVRDVVFLPEGDKALSVSEDQTVILWDLARGATIRSYGVPDVTLHRVAASPDGRRALLGALGGAVLLLDLDNGRVIQRMLGHSGRIVAVAAHPDGRSVLSGSADGTLRLWDLYSGAEMRRAQFAPDLGVALSLDVSLDGRQGLIGFYEGGLLLWDMAGGSEIRRLQGHTESVFGGVYLLPDGRRAVSGSGDIVARARDNTVRVWDLETGAQERRFEGHADRIWHLALSPCGRYALSAGHDGIVRLWDLDAGAGACAGRTLLDLAPQAARCTAISPDGRTALVGPARGSSTTPDYSLRLLDLETGREVRRLAGYGEMTTALAISPDGRLALACALDGTIHVWDLESGERVGSLEGHSRLVLRLFFAPQGEIAISASIDQTVIVWDLATGQALRRYFGHDSAVTGIVLARDGKTVISVGADRTMREWRIDATQHDLVEWIRANRYVPELTPEQRAQHQVDLLQGPQDRS